MNEKSTLPLAMVAAVAATLPPTTAQAQAAVSERRTIDEVVVTAQKREESIQDVPVAVTALSDLQLERAGVQDLRDLSTIAASFNMNSSQTESQGSVLRIRGVGTTGNNIGLESAVGVFLDGVHLSRPGIALGDLMDIEAIEVLRGPQGTLFGRNTSAGALVIRSKRPDLDNFEAFVNASAGNFGSSNIQVGGNLPIAEGRLAARGTVAFRQQNGFVKSTTGAESMDRDRIALRGQLLWNIDDRADLRIIADYADASEQCCDAPILVESPLAAESTPAGFNAFQAAGLPADGGAPASGSQALNQRRSNGGQFENPFEQWGISAELNWDFETFDLTYIGSYRYFDASSVQFSDFVGTNVFSVRPEVANGQRSFDEIETTTHELRLAGENGRLQWMIGGFFMWEDIVEGQGLGLESDFSRNTSANLFGLAQDPTAIQTGFATLAALGVELADGTPFGDVLATDPTNPALAFTNGIDPAGAFARNRFNQTTRSWSVFTHNTLRITDDLDFVFGLRWVDEDKDGTFRQAEASNPACLAALGNAGALPGNTAAAATAAGLTDGETAELVGLASGAADVTAGFTCFPFAAPAVDPDSGIPLPQEFDRNFSDTELVWTARGVYRFDDVTMGYASFTHGFKAGGFNLDATAALGGANPRFESETVDAWEIGLKTELFDRRVRLNTALFYQDLDDFQVLDFTGVQFQTFNVPNAESKGVEVELQAAPLRQLDVNLAVTYQDASYPGNCDANDPNAPPQVAALCGARLTNAPDWTGVFSATWEDRLGTLPLNYFIHGNLRAESKRRTGTQAQDPDSLVPAAGDFQGAHAKINLRLGVASLDERWAFEVWSNNITDKQTRNVTFNIPLRGVGSLGNAARGAFIEAPRTFGATFRARL